MRFHLSWISITLILFTSCTNDSGITTPIEIYQIRSYATKAGTFQIDESTVKTFDSPIIYYQDIYSYDAANYSFEISDQAKRKLLEPAFAQPGVPFAVMASGRIIYTGYFWWSFSSGFCDWVVADLTFLSIDNILKMNLGYPGATDDMRIPDRRNDPALLQILRSDGKLK